MNEVELTKQTPLDKNMQQPRSGVAVLVRIGVNVCRLLLAATLIFSGLVKLIDPTGTQYKIEDYSAAIGLSLSDFLFVPLSIAVTLALTEFLLGVNLLFGIRRLFTTRLTLLLMCVMTAITLWLALTDAVSDCGCFGDAIHLTNWQTFCKNLVLLTFAAIVWWKGRMLPRFISESVQWIISLYSFVYGLFIAALCIYALPIIDFRPFHIGQNIPKAMEWPEDVNKQPEILDFNIEPIKSYFENQYLITTDELLADTGYTFLLTAPHFEDADDGALDRINAISDYCDDYGYRFLCLTASDSAAIERWCDLTGADYPFAFTDELTLKTMVRSNPGLILLHGGTIVGKWSSNTLPEESELQGPLHTLPLAHPRLETYRLMLARLFMWYVLPLLLLTFIDRLIATVKWWYLRRKKAAQLVNSEKSTTFAASIRNLSHQTNKTMRKKIVAGNWKMNLTLQEGLALATELKEALAAEKPNCDVVICTPFIHLAKVADVVEGTVIGLGAENCADKEKGAYTGEVSAAQVKSTGAQYVILGHSERRAYYGETAEILKEKVNLALANGLKVIFCIGEVLEEREAGKQNEVVGSQLADSLFDLTEEQLKNIILAYEPVWAIGTGKTATAEQAEDMHAFIRGVIAGRFGEAAAENISILYGGSCKPSNAREIFAKVDVDGGLIGGAALKCADFKGIIDAWN